MSSPDFFGISDRIRQLTAPAGFEGVHEDGFSWARQGTTWSDTTRIGPTEWNMLIGNLRGIGLMPDAVSNDFDPSGPYVLRDALVNFVTVRIDTYIAAYVNALNASLATKAPLASPTFTGVPRVPTPASNDDTTQIPNTEWVQARIVEIMGEGVTSGLSTIADLAAAIQMLIDTGLFAESRKEQVVFASTGNVTLTGPQTVDGGASGNGQRVLIKDQTDPAENGIWVTSTEGAWTRATDADVGSELASCIVYVKSGTQNAETSWFCGTPAPITLGTTPITFYQTGSPSDGVDGRTLLNGAAAPGAGLGADGDFYIETTNWRLYGPKTAGAWGGYVALRGTNGTNGTNGTDGVDMLAQRYRPGDAPILHAGVLTEGDPQAVAHLGAGDTMADDDGAVVRLTGPGIVASRTLMAMEPARLCQSRFVVRRRVNTGDPASEIVRLGIAWYDQNKIRLAGADAQTVVLDIDDLTVASGRRQVIGTFSRSAGVGADNVAPATARYARPYVETFGDSLVATDVEVIDTLDTTDLTAWSPDVSVFDGRLVVLESLDIADRLTDLEAAVGAPTVLHYQTVTEAEAASIAAYVDYIEVLGDAAVSDGKRAIYERSASPPVNGFTTVDGAHWERVTTYLSGAIYDPTNVEDDAFDSANHAFLQAGTGAVERSAQSKMRELFSVLDFDQGDGDDAMFSRAARAAPAYDTLGPPNNVSVLPRGETCSVYVPSGEYTLTDLVDVDNRNVTWVLDPGARFTGSTSDYLNGRTTRAGLKINHGQPFGVMDDTTGFIVNYGRGFNDKPAPVTGVTSLTALADYAQRDGVAAVFAAYSQDALASPATATYTATTATIALMSADEQKRLRKGMVIETKHAPAYIGVLESWAHGANTVLTIKTGWYEARNSGAGLQTPADGTGLYVSRVNKIWSINPVLNMQASHDTEEGIGSELSVYNQLGGDSSMDIDTKTNRVWCYLAAAGAEAGFARSQVGFISRGWYNYGHVADDQLVGFYYKTINTGRIAFKSRMPITEIILDAEDTTSGRRYRITASGDTEHGDPNVSTAGGRLVSFHTSGLGYAYDSRIRATGGSSFAGNGTLNYDATTHIFGGVVRPSTDNARTLGSASFRWSVVYAGTGTINTSDERNKQDIGPIPEKWLDAWGDVEWVRYKWKDAVAAKEKGARWHTGLIAQQIERAFKKHNLDAFEIGILCRDPVTTLVTRTRMEDRPVYEDVEVDIVTDELVDGAYVRNVSKGTERRTKTIKVPVLNADGSPFLEDQLDPAAAAAHSEVSRMRPMPAYRYAPITEQVEVEYEAEEETGEWRYGVRYDEAQAIEAAWVRRELKRLIR